MYCKGTFRTQSNHIPLVPNVSICHNSFVNRLSLYRSVTHVQVLSNPVDVTFRCFSSTNPKFDEKKSREDQPAWFHHVADLLPHQGILENFIHHNPLHELEHMGFKDALEHAHKIESYMSPGERVFHVLHVDPRKRVNEALSELSAAFLDRGAAKWAPRYRDKGFLFFFATHEGLGFAPWRKHARDTAKRILAHYSQHSEPSTTLAETILKENLEAFGVPEEEFQDAVTSMVQETRGWAGMFYRMETHPLEAPANVKVKLMEFCAVKSILLRSSIESLTLKTKWEGVSLATWMKKAPKHRTHKEEVINHTSAIAFLDQASERREHLETQFKYMLLNTIGTAKPVAINQPNRPSLQLYTCIDDRECSFRRHVEETKPNEIETFGVAGFFGIPIKYKPADGRSQMILAPEGQDPTAVLVEGKSMEDYKNILRFKRTQRFFARLSLMWENASFSAIGSLALSAFFPLSMARLFMMGFFPGTRRKMEEQFRKKILRKPQPDFQLPFPPEQAASMLSRTFNDIGTQNRFAPIVVVLGHGAISVNNPFAAAYNCGACGGREGGPNARLLARLANDKQVRACLQKDYNIQIPDDTVFIGGAHNTTTDTVQFYDTNLLPESHKDLFVKVQETIEQALGENALERCQRFLLAKTVRTTEEALQHVRMRGTDYAEVRPELNHATNAAVVVGRRELTKLRFLDRRVFLPSYDPLSDDDNGTNLEHVLAPALIVCSGINLEYLFSTISVDHHGAGTKAPLNIVANIGVLQGTSGDLRPGLPSQMTEMHTPVRALFVVDAPIKRVEAVLARRPELRNLVRNEWVQFVVRDPETGSFFRQSQGDYLPVDIEGVAPTVHFHHHRNHGLNVARHEDMFYWSATAGMLLSCALPIYFWGSTAMNPFGSLIALCGTMLSLPILAFSRRYLHGEFMFGRFQALCVGLLLGFNMVATAPNLEHVLAGWSLFGFSSTFLIGAYNDRPTVRNNATFAFAAYRISDFALLVAAVFAHSNPALSAGALLLAAFFKSSQFPLTALFLRSMEGPTPASALGYAGLSAHVGVVLLTSTMDLWFGFEWARIALGAVGIITAVHSSLISKIRSDRKGSLARATSATIGLIFVTLALGHPHIALLMSLGHAAFRIIQVLHAPNMITHTQNLSSALGYTPWPKVVPDWLYRLTWALRRVDTDFHLINVLNWISRRFHKPKTWSKMQQWFATGAIVVLAGAPFTPVSHYLDELLVELLPTHPVLAGTVMVGHFAVSVVMIRWLLLNVLHNRRFHK